MSSQLHYKITADISNAQQGLIKIKEEFLKAGNEGAKLGQKLQGNLTKGTNSAAFALTNLGRVAQDAPFGFIGIQNNLNPLLESFQRLKAESGSSGKALKALAGSLMGAGGIGLALSLASGAFLLYQKYMAGASKESGKFAESQKAIAEFVKETASNYGKEAAQLNILRASIESATVPMATRLQAIKNIQKEYPQYFAGLTNEQILTGNVAGAYDMAAQAILRKARAAAAANKIEELYAKIQEVQIRNAERAEEANKKLKNARPTSGVIAGGQFGGSQVIKSSLAEVKRSIVAKYNLQKQADQDEVNGYLAQQKVLLKYAVDGAAETIKVETEKIKKVAKEREKSFKGFKPIRFDETPIEFIDPLDFNRQLITSLEKIKGQSNVFYQLPVKLETSVSTDNLSDLQRLADIAYLKAAGVSKSIQDGLNIGVEGLRFPELNTLVADTQTKLKSLNEAIKASLQESIVGIGEALGESLSGAGDFLSLLASNIFKTMGSFLVQMGKAAVVEAKLFTAIKAATKNPAIGLVGGLAAIAFGTLLKNIKIPAFANGGNTPGGLALVGERGPELVNLPSGARVTPSHLTDIRGGNNIQVMIPELTLRGQDLRIAFNRANDSYRRSS